MTKERQEAFLAELSELSNKHSVAIYASGMEVDCLELRDISKESGRYETHRIYGLGFCDWVETK